MTAMSTDNRNSEPSTADLSEAASRNTLALNPLVGIRGQDLVDSAGILFKAVTNEPRVATEQWLSFIGELGSIIAGKSERSPKASDKRLEAWLQEVPSRLATLMRDLQFVLTELAPKSAFPPSRQDQVRLASIKERQMEAYDRWRQSHGDIAKPSETVEWNRATQDEIAD